MFRTTAITPARIAVVFALVLAAPAIADAQIASPFSSSLDTDADWTLSSLWEVDDTPASVTPPNTPPTSLNFNNGTDFAGQNSGAARSPVINLMNATSGTLTFQCWYETEDTGTSYDQRWFRIINADTGAQMVNSQLATTGGSITCAGMNQWHEHSIDLTQVAGNNIQLEFFFDTRDTVANNYPGWFIDDLLILTPDVTPPLPITDLAVSNPTLTTLRVTWTSRSDDDISGIAASFDLRYSAFPITTDAEFTGASLVNSLPDPDVPGTVHTVTVGNLQEGTKFYFAIKATDFAGNVSLLSNLPFGTTVEPPPVSTKGGAGAEEDRYAYCGASAASSPAALILLAAIVALAAAARAFKMH